MSSFIIRVMILSNTGCSASSVGADRVDEGGRRWHGGAWFWPHREQHLGSGESAHRHLGLSNGARSGLTGFVAGLARQPQLAGRNVTINALLPGPFDTDRLRGTMAGAAAKTGKTGKTGKSMEELMDSRRKLNPTGRFGNAQEVGASCALLCSQ